MDRQQSSQDLQETPPLSSRRPKPASLVETNPYHVGYDQQGEGQHEYETLPLPHSPPPRSPQAAQLVETNPYHVGYDQHGEEQPEYENPLPQPHSPKTPQLVEANPYHTGYDQQGDRQFRYEQNLNQKQGQLGQYNSTCVPKGTYPPRQTSQHLTVSKPAGRASQLSAAICVTLCCFSPTGILAMLFALQAQKMFALGNIEKAKRHQRLAKIFIFLSLGLGFPLHVASWIWYYYRLMAEMNQISQH